MERSGRRGQCALATAAALVVALTAAASAGQAGDKALIGRWHTEREGGVVEIHRCGEALCGRVVDGVRLRVNPDQRDVRNPDRAQRSRKVLGVRVLNGFSGGPGRWKGGPLYDPETGNLAGSGTLTLADPDTLKVQGCIAMFLCKTQTWRRAR
ncbi:DUF2147 domain-containing protein [Sphingomonas gei]|uniref:DUF2147 domain-containing protein n=1 Tax=Sphingomonas gei TaxID=1395960 RepID=A0A4S1XEB9_9SPHN|nr:DUF2147 domain-containing protein [Sphingomonas gei]TGX54308.1 DUF2147 domain-containing protein [Sphingomonas gei]